VANLIIIATLVITSIDIGGQVGIGFPTGGINRTTRSSTVIGLQTGLNLNRHRLQLGSSYFNFPGRNNAPYE
jgi:hypothetical protein